MRAGGVAKGIGAFLAGLTMLAVAAGAAPGLVTQNINMRAGPGIDYPLVAQLPAGTPAEIFGCLSGWGWCDTAVGDVRGWVAGAGLQLLYDDQPEPLYEYGAVIGVPLVGFDVNTYWGHHYRGRPWYHDADRWRGEGSRGGLPGGYRGQPGIAYPVGPTGFQDRRPEPGRAFEPGRGPVQGRPPELGRGPEQRRPPELGRGPEQGRPPELGRGPEQGRPPNIVTPHEAMRASEPGPRQAPPFASRPGPAPAPFQQGPRPGPGPQGPAPGGRPNPGPPGEPHGGREPLPR